MGSESLPILLLVALLVMFWLVVLRPARRAQQETANVQNSLEVGDEVVISSGIYGRVTELDDVRAKLEIAPGTVIEVARQVVVRKVADEESGPQHVSDETASSTPELSHDPKHDEKD